MNFEKLYNKVLHFLSFRPRSEKEIKDYISKKTKDEKHKNKIFIKLKTQGLVNDEEFADWWIDQRLSFKPRGKRLLKKELLEKGIDREIIDRKLLAICNKELTNLAKKLVEKKIKLYGKLPPLKLKKKLFSFLGRRGFDWQQIDLVIDEFLQK